MTNLRPAQSASRVRFPAPYRPAGADRGPDYGIDRGLQRGDDIGSADPGLDPNDGGRGEMPRSLGGAPRGSSSGRPAPGPASLRRGHSGGPIELADYSPRPSAGGPAGGPDSGPSAAPRGGHAGPSRPGLSGGRVGGRSYGEGPLVRTSPRSGEGGPQTPDATGGSGGGVGARNGRVNALTEPGGMQERGSVAPRPDHGHDDHGHHDHHHHDDGHHHGSCYPWGFSYYNGYYSFAFGYGYGCNYWWYWPFYVSCYYPIWYASYYPTYYPSYPAYSTVYYDDDPDVVYVESQPSSDYPVGEAVVNPPSKPATESAASGALPESMHIAAQRYLDLGDQAFRDGRFADAVQFYAKATALAPDEAALHLVLADALFATGDYHYAAYSIRRALEIDPKLAETSVDKHDFYSDPNLFDAQLARLETHCEEHPEDADARLVLATNQLFGRRPYAAVRLLERASGPAAGASAADPAVELVLAAARKAQEGVPAPPPEAPPEPAKPD